MKIKGCDWKVNNRLCMITYSPLPWLVGYLIHRTFITLLSVQLLLCGPSEYDSWMLKKFRMETQIQTEISTSHCYILRAHAVAWCYVKSHICHWNWTVAECPYLLEIIDYATFAPRMQLKMRHILSLKCPLCNILKISPHQYLTM
jgi:hypothetical protein